MKGKFAYKGGKNSKKIRNRRESKTSMTVVSPMPSNIRKLPIYDKLSADLNQRIAPGVIDITLEHKTKICTILNSMKPAQAMEVTLLLIHHTYLTNPELNPFTPANCNPKGSKNLPYDIHISPSLKGFSFDFDKLPPTCQALLGIYCL